MWLWSKRSALLPGLCSCKRKAVSKTGAQWQLARCKGTARASASVAACEAVDQKPETEIDAAKAAIQDRISGLKVSELNNILKACGLVQGAGKEFKIAALCEFVSRSQEMAEKRHRSARQSKGKRRSSSFSEIHESFVPEEVVSIDIGFRNLAFAHISRSGQVLDWRRVELLKEAAFEPWILASVVEEFVQNVLPVRPATACTYVIEHQRFRSQGSSAVTNSVMVNNLIEALLYANLRHAGAHVEPINPTLISSHWGFIGSRKSRAHQPCNDVDADGDGEGNDGDSTSSSGGLSAQDAKADAKEQLVQTILTMEAALREQKIATKTQHALLAQALGLKPPRRAAATRSTSLQDADRDKAKLQAKTKAALSVSRDQKRRLLKKERTIAMVQAWVLASLAPAEAEATAEAAAGDAQASTETDSSKAALHREIRSYLAQFSTLKRALAPDRPMAFSKAAAGMFCKEAKQDDLCDCLVQGVAWLQWQQYIVGVLRRFGSESAPGS